MITRCGRIALLAALWLISIASLFPEGRSESPKRVVYATDIQNGMQIIGLLGIPLGDLASISARIVPSSSKETKEYIEILEINKTKLSKPIQLIFSIWQWGNLSNIKLPLNKTLSLRVYETGGMEGVPQNAMKETSYVASVGWDFRTSVVILYEER